MKTIRIFIIIAITAGFVTGCENPLTEEEYSKISYDFADAFEEWNDTTGSYASLIQGGEVLPYVQATTVHSGTYAVHLGPVSSNRRSIFQAEISVDADSYLSFDYLMLMDYYAYLYLVIGGTSHTVGSFSNTVSSWASYSRLLPTGTYTVQWMLYSTSSVEQTGFIDNITLTPLPDFSNAFEEWDDSAGSYASLIQGGDVLPYAQTATIHSGSYAVQLGPATSYEESIFQAEITLNTNSILSFSYLKDYYTDLYLVIDGTSETVSSYYTIVSSWTSYSRVLPAGTYTVQWCLYPASSTEQTGFVDNITLTPQ